MPQNERACAWGNIIDQVHYSNSSPWPTEADGNGPFLALKDLDADNSLPENWTVDYDLTDVKDLHDARVTIVFPNPTKDIVHIKGIKADKVQIYNILGQLVKSFGGGNDISLTGLSEGLYLMLITDGDGRKITEKLVVE